LDLPTFTTQSINVAVPLNKETYPARRDLSKIVYVLMQAVGPNEDLSSAAHNVGLKTDSGAAAEDLVAALTRAKDEAEVALALSELRIVEYSQQLASTEERMTFWKKKAEDQRGHCRRLQAQMDECHRQLQTTLPKNERLCAENDQLRNRCGQLEHRLHSQQQQQKQSLADLDRKFAEETARNNDLEQKLSILAQHLKEEHQKKSGGCTLSIAFDTQQRQDQYMEAVRGLLQPVEDKYVLNIETLQAPKSCSFLLYVTYSSSHRLVNFDNDAFERFKQSCSTGSHLKLIYNTYSFRCPSCI
jgi:chromosome segregation ATPase